VTLKTRTAPTGDITVRQLTAASDIEPLLDARRPYAATAYPYLEDRLRGQATWTAASGPSGTALVMEAHGRAGAALYLQGDPAAIAAILATQDPARHCYLTYEAAHASLVPAHFALRARQRLVRMLVDRATFQPVASAARRLSGNNAGDANALYSSDSGAWLSRRHLDEETYFGMWDNGRVVSIAGTQLIAPQHHIAMVANVLTHRGYRDMGYATQCVSALTQDLLAGVRDVVLNVDPDNTPAIRVYRRLGYRETGHLEEAWGMWRGRTWFDRALATLYGWFSW
jgi:RimJ/RimL family protein N-acetyltransferase